jgi:hypothetical protein
MRVCKCANTGSTYTVIADIQKVAAVVLKPTLLNNRDKLNENFFAVPD